MKKIKVVLADDNENIRQSIRGLLELDGEIDVIAEATDGKDVLEKIKTMEPEIVVMDVNMPGIDGIEATEYITLNHPNIYVVMISVDDNIQNFKKAMMAGAKEYLIKPLSPHELNDTVKKVAELGRKNTARNQAEPPGPKVPLKENRIITVFGTKGGVGKSTICANVAVTAAEKGRAGKIAIVDLDIQFGDISVMMNINPRKTISELMQEGENLNRELFEGFLYERYGVNIMPSTNKPELAELVTSHGVHKILEICKDMHEYTFVDTPSFIDDITLTALEMSQVI
ncbi:MAG: MinD/ParA family protein, partial [Syntrophomonadaceae bacterium]|nr:MinD/ParA family protein [Syntrophomonadaceae bacterium]